MTLVDSPSLPVPGAVSRRLADRGVIFREQAGRLTDTDPSAESIHGYTESNWEWTALLEAYTHALPGAGSARGVLGLSPETIRRALLRHLNGRYVHSFRFFRLIHRLSPRRHRAMLLAPRSIRAAFVQAGVPLEGAITPWVWAVCKIVLLLHGLAEVMRHAVLALLAMARSTPATGRPLLWLGLSPAELSAESGELNALEFVRARRLPLFDSGPLYISAPWRRGAPEDHVADVHACISADPVRHAAGQHLAARLVWQLVRESFVVMVRICRDGLRDDGLGLLLARDYAELPRMRVWLSSVRPRAIVLTNSMFGTHPLWLALAPAAGAEVVMVFYATNVQPMTLRGGRPPVPGDPGYALLECMRFEVWTPAQKQWLTSLGIDRDKVHVAGVVVWGSYAAWRTPDTPAPALRTRRIRRIGLFDVVPPSAAYYLQFGLGNNYYEYDRMAQLLTDVVQLAQLWPGEKPEVLLKPKRRRMAIHDPRYYTLRDHYLANGSLSAHVLPTNPIDAVAACDLVIAPPFSSPTVIAEQMGIPACFYDPTGLVMPHDGLPAEAPLVSGRAALQQWLAQFHPAKSS